MSQYLLASQAESERLRLQARTWEAEAEAMLDRTGAQPGWACLDVGCGAMGILRPLEQRAGPGGRVVGIDPEAPLLSSARDYVREERLANVELLERDVLRSGLAPGSFDLVHERFVFPHVQDPPAVLRAMIELARPGGVVATQEADQSSYGFLPASGHWTRLKEIIEAAFALRSDINIGRRTFGLLREAGLEQVTVRAAVLALQDGHPYMRMPLVGIAAMRKRIVAAGISTEAELDELTAAVERHAADPGTIQITFTLVQVWGKRPRAG